MKPHRTASAVSISAWNDGRAVESPANRRTGSSENGSRQPAPSEPSSGAASARARAHTLVLIGELDSRSAHALEAELERLCEEGVASITLDLRELTHIDSVGAAVIAFRCALCKRRGHELVLIPGPQNIQRVFERAGTSQLLPFRRDDVPTPRRLALVLGERSEDVSGDR